jgi:hypothetical protein
MIEELMDEYNGGMIKFNKGYFLLPCGVGDTE